MKWIIAAGLIALPILAWNFPARAHDDATWIMSNPAISWCCGPEDCKPLNDDSVTISPSGVVVKETGETIPHQDIKESIDGRWWRCHRPGGLTRCLFSPPAGT